MSVDNRITVALWGGRTPPGPCSGQDWLPELRRGAGGSGGRSGRRQRPVETQARWPPAFTLEMLELFNRGPGVRCRRRSTTSGH